MLESPEQATPSWLTAVLRESGRLAHGRVASVERRTTTAFNSTVTHLDLAYAPGSDRAAPRALVLKLALPAGWARRAGATEVAFYRAVARRRLPMLARCVAAEHDAESGRALLLLDDLDPTHEAATTRRNLAEGARLPAAARIDLVVDALAGLHAAFWGAPAPDGIPRAAWLESESTFARYVDRSRAELESLKRASGARVSERALTVTEHTLRRLHQHETIRMRHRAASARSLTLVHGDCYLSNWLLPRAGVEAGAVAVDFQQVHVDTPGEDLAFLLGALLTPEQRVRLEARCLQRYLATLNRPDYRRPDLLEDYRWGLEQMVARTVWDHSHGTPEWYWRPKLERVTAALAAQH